MGLYENSFGGCTLKIHSTYENLWPIHVAVRIWNTKENRKACPLFLIEYCMLPNFTSNFYHYMDQVIKSFSNFSCMFLNPNIFSNLNLNYSNLTDLRNLQEQVKKTFCYQKLYRPFNVWIPYTRHHRPLLNTSHT